MFVEFFVPLSQQDIVTVLQVTPSAYNLSDKGDLIYWQRIAGLV